MTKTLRIAMYLFVLIGIGSLGTAKGTDPTLLRNTANPDPSHIQGGLGEPIIQVNPRNDSEDWRNLQWAAENVVSAGTIHLGAGTFFLGDGKISPKTTVTLRQGIRIVGERDGQEWRTIIRGGGAVDVFSVLGGKLESGAFRVVNEHDQQPSVFEDLWFREWTAEAVYVESSAGFEMRRCRISHPVNTAIEGATRFIHAIFSSGSRAGGDFIVEDNLVELGVYDGPLPDDEQFLGVFYSNHDNIRVAGNDITGLDEAIEIIGNRSDLSQLGGGPPAIGPAGIVVEDNHIDVTQTLGDRWPGTFAILVAGNRAAEAVRIAGNDLAVRGKGWALALSGERMSISDNRVRLEPYDGSVPAGAVTIGFGRLGVLDMGSSLTDSVFENNVFEGKVSVASIVFRPGRADMPNRSAGNDFDLGSSMAALGAPTTLSIAETVRGNTFRGDLGNVVDLSPECSNTYERPES